MSTDKPTIPFSADHAQATILSRALDKLGFGVAKHGEAIAERNEIVKAQEALRDGTQQRSMPIVCDAGVPLAQLKMALQGHGLETYLAYDREGDKLVTVLHVRTIEAGNAHRESIRNANGIHRTPLHERDDPMRDPDAFPGDDELEDDDK